jgi:hypothetical protein
MVCCQLRVQWGATSALGKYQKAFMKILYALGNLSGPLVERTFLIDMNMNCVNFLGLFLPYCMKAIA